jgi:hypothetical protein
MFMDALPQAGTTGTIVLMADILKVIYHQLFIFSNIKSAKNNAKLFLI